MTSADDIVRAERLLGASLHEVSLVQGGTHARTYAAVADGRAVIVRAFPDGEDVVRRERAVLREIAPLLGQVAVPEFLAADPDTGVIVTTRVPGGHPAPEATPAALAGPLARALAAIHSLPVDAARAVPLPTLTGGDLADAAAARFARGEQASPVRIHGDYWCGNALWDGARLTGVVDWNGSAVAPAGLDVAWCRQDLVLLGDITAAEVFLDEYLSLAPSPGDILAWDLRAAVHADGRVGEWAPNYAGIGRPELTADVLEARFRDWSDRLLSQA